MEYKINTFEKLQKACEEEGKEIYEIMQEKESYDFQTNVKEVRARVWTTLEAMETAIERGMKSEEKSYSGLCGDDCIKLKKRYENSSSVLGKVFEKVTLYSLSTMEENLRMHKIAACPTAGSCGVVPSVITGLSEEKGKSSETKINALITAGTIGYIISSKVAMAGAVAGCQAECGVAAAMSAGAAVYILGGNNEQIITAAALALKNVLGLTCDPVGGLVEIPCVKRNVFMSIHAITAAELALSGIESKIPADEVVDAMVQTGQLMSPILKETSQGGLAVTKTGIEISRRLQNTKG